MNKKKKSLPLVYLHPGEFRFSNTPEVITTVLGSCVSVTMHVKRLRMGSIFHALLPTNRENVILEEKKDYNGKDEVKTKLDTIGKYNLKYVDDSIYFMLENFDKYKIDRREIDVKVFGGASLLIKSNPENLNTISVGKQNIETALKTLANENLEITASDLGGNWGRKLFFFTESGEIYIKLLGQIEKESSVDR